MRRHEAPRDGPRPACSARCRKPNGQIGAALGTPVALRQNGSVLLAHRGDEGAARRVLDLLRSKAPPAYAPEGVTSAGLHELEPAGQGPTHAWLLPSEGQIHTVQAMD